MKKKYIEENLPRHFISQIASLSNEELIRGRIAPLIMEDGSEVEISDISQDITLDRFSQIFENVFNLGIILPKKFQSDLKESIEQLMEYNCHDLDNIIKENFQQLGEEVDEMKLMSMAGSYTILAHFLAHINDSYLSELISEEFLKLEATKSAQFFIEDNSKVEEKYKHIGAVTLEGLFKRSMLYRSKLEANIAQIADINIDRLMKDGFSIDQEDLNKLRTYVQKQLSVLGIQPTAELIKTNFQELLKLANHVAKIQVGEILQEEFNSEIINQPNENFIDEIKLENFNSDPEIKLLLKNNQKMLKLQAFTTHNIIAAFGKVFEGVDLDYITYPEYAQRLKLVEKEVGRNLDLVHNCLPLEEMYLAGRKAAATIPLPVVAIESNTPIRILEEDYETSIIAFLNSKDVRKRAGTSKVKSDGEISGPLADFFQNAKPLVRFVKSCIGAIEYYQAPPNLLPNVKEKRLFGFGPKTNKLDFEIINLKNETMTPEGVALIASIKAFEKSNYQLNQLPVEEYGRDAESVSSDSLSASSDSSLGEGWQTIKDSFKGVKIHESKSDTSKDQKPSHTVAVSSKKSYSPRR